MSVSEDEGATTQELEFDMWEGQFEFLGDQFNNNNVNELDYEQVPINGNGVYDRNSDLQLSWRPLTTKKNGLKKTQAQLWCEDLTQHVQMLQQQMNVLADNQTNSDERYTKAKQDNATLQARVLMLEEQLREVELRSEERLADEERRHRELVARVDREKQLQVENCAIRLQTLELENNTLKEEAHRCKSQLEKLRLEKIELEDKLLESEVNLSSVNEELVKIREQERKYREKAHTSQQLIDELSLEIEKLQQEKMNAEMLAVALKNNSTNEETPLQSELEALRQQHKNLREQYEELQAVMLTKGVEEGRNLLTTAGPTSLAAELELEAMTHEDLDGRGRDELKIQTALKEAQEVNTQLRSYIDGILLLIVENCPRLLEVKKPPPAP